MYSDDPTLHLALDTIKKGKQGLVFANTKRSAEKTAEELSKKVNTSSNELTKLSLDIVKDLAKPTKQCERLARCIKKGVAFHHAGLTSHQKDIIEDQFRKNKIKIICCTPTLAMGVDLPAFRAIMKDLRRYGPHGYNYIPVLEYLQMAGRAGRPSYDDVGEAVIVAPNDSEKEKLVERYIHGEPESLQSKLAVEPVLRTYILSLIASNFVNSKKEIFDFFEDTFWAFQFEATIELRNKIEGILEILTEWEFLIGSKDDFVSANEIEDEHFRATPLGQRVAQLYIDPLTAHNFIECIKKATKHKLCAYSFLQMVASAGEIVPLRVKTKEYEKMQEALVKYDPFLLIKEPSLYEPEYDDFLRSIKTAMLIQEWIEEKDEEYLLENYDIRPGELRVKLDVSDWLLYCTEELTRILHFPKLLGEISKTRVRVKNGVREELLPLLKLKGIGRARARRLHFNRVRTLGDVRSADIMKLVQILGKAVAIDVKKQVGQDFDKAKVKEGKRKGQISLNDF